MKTLTQSISLLFIVSEQIHMTIMVVMMLAVFDDIEIKLDTEISELYSSR